MNLRGLIVASLLAAVPSLGAAELAVNTWALYFRQAESLAELARNGSRFNEIGAFAYQFDANGRLIPAEDFPANWPQTLKARFPQTRILTTVVNDAGNVLKDPKVVDQKIGTPDARRAHIAELVALAAQSDGLDIDYEALTPGETTRQNFNLFIDELSAELHARGKYLSVLVEPPSSSRPIDWAYVASKADRLRVMAYYYSYESSRPGSVASPSDIAGLLNRALNTLQIPPGKLELVLSANGFDWPEGGRGRQLSALEAVRLAARMGATIERDPATSAAWFRYVDAAGVRHEVWFDDSEALARKADLIRARGLTNVGIWSSGAVDLTDFFRWVQPARVVDRPADALQIDLGDSYTVKLTTAERDAFAALLQALPSSTLAGIRRVDARPASERPNADAGNWSVDGDRLVMYLDDPSTRSAAVRPRVSELARAIGFQAYGRLPASAKEDFRSRQDTLDETSIRYRFAGLVAGWVRGRALPQTFEEATRWGQPDALQNALLTASLFVDTNRNTITYFDWDGDAFTPVAEPVARTGTELRLGRAVFQLEGGSVTAVGTLEGTRTPLSVPIPLPEALLVKLPAAPTATSGAASQAPSRAVVTPWLAAPSSRAATGRRPSDYGSLLSDEGQRRLKATLERATTWPSKPASQVTDEMLLDTPHPVHLGQ